MKQCTKCKEYKDESEFYKAIGNTNGLNKLCKICYKKEKNFFRELYPWKSHLVNAKYRCTNPKCKDYPHWGGRGIEFHLTDEEGEILWNEAKAWLMKCPSIHRIDNDGNYTFNNCVFIELSENSKEHASRMISKLVLQYDLQGNFIKEWKSMLKIEKTLGIKISNISAVCLNKYGSKSAGGFIWRFKKEKIKKQIKINYIINKPILQFDLKGNFIKEWFSISQASHVLNINRGIISKICNNKYNFLCKFNFKFKE